MVTQGWRQRCVRERSGNGAGRSLSASVNFIEFLSEPVTHSSHRLTDSVSVEFPVSMLSIADLTARPYEIPPGALLTLQTIIIPGVGVRNNRVLTAER